MLAKTKRATARPEFVCASLSVLGMAFCKMFAWLVGCVDLASVQVHQLSSHHVHKVAAQLGQVGGNRCFKPLIPGISTDIVESIRV